MKKPAVAAVVLVGALALTARSLPAQTTPKLALNYTQLKSTLIDPSYVPLQMGSMWNTDLDGDGNQDLVVVGGNSPSSQTCGTACPNYNVPQPGRVFLGDGDGHFTVAPADKFPTDTLRTVQARELFFPDFNGDGRPDMFVSTAGWDASPFTGEQNRLYLSRATGGWSDATSTLPQITDFSHSSSIGDIGGRGVVDIFVGNGALRRLGQPYTLLNDGNGQFTKTTTDIPAGPNELLDPDSGHNFGGSRLLDLDGNGLPELIVMGDAASTNLRHSTILWNQSGAFSQTNTTELPVTNAFPNAHLDLDVRRIDVNQDGLQDLVVAGTQGQPAYYNGWFVQVLVNRGNRVFVDETADRIPSGESFGGIEGIVTNGNPYGKWVRVLDFNQDGFPDISLEHSEGFSFTQSQPLVWVNDGSGHFTTLRVKDFVVPGNEFMMGTTGHLVPTRNGYSFIRLLGDARGLFLDGLLATKRKLPGVGR